MEWERLNDSQLAEAYKEKAEALHALFEKGGEEMKLSDADVQEIRSLNKTLHEIKAIQEKRAVEKKDRSDLDDIRKAADMALGDSRTPARAHNHGGAQDPAKQNGMKTLGQLFVESRAFTEFSSAHGRSPEVTLEIGDVAKRLAYSEVAAKALLDTGDWPSTDMRLPGLTIEYPRRRPMVADLIPQGTTTSQVISYVAELVGVNNADFVAEGALKPESELGFEERSAQVRKIATWIPVTDELMADEPAIRSIIDARLRLFVQLAEEDALMTGSGTPPAFTGMYNTSGIQTQAKGTDPVPDAIYKAMVKIQVNAFLQPSGVIMHPNDWMDIRLLRTADGQYIWGSPADESAVERIWGLPVVSTQAATENSAIVGAFDAATQIFRREGITFAVSSEHDDFFIRNQMAIRAEERLAFVVFRPAGLATVTGI